MLVAPQTQPWLCYSRQPFGLLLISACLLASPKNAEEDVKSRVLLTCACYTQPSCGPSLHKHGCSLAGTAILTGPLGVRQPCSLPGCGQRCKEPHGSPHERHWCSQSECPSRCILCGSMCASSSHFHALDPAARHLCSRQHACVHPVTLLPFRCKSLGVCEIRAQPTIETRTFSVTPPLQSPCTAVAMAAMPLDTGAAQQSMPHLGLLA